MFNHNDLVRLNHTTGADDHEGRYRIWSVSTVFRVLHPTTTGDVVVSDDSRGLRTVFPLGALVSHRRAEQTQGS